MGKTTARDRIVDESLHKLQPLDPALIVSSVCLGERPV